MEKTANRKRAGGANVRRPFSCRARNKSTPIEKTARECSAGFVIFGEHEGKRLYLLLHYEEGHWDFPKGHVERGETETVAAGRELWEETGIRKSEIEILPHFSHPLSYEYLRAGTKFHKTVVFFIAKTKSRKIFLSREHIGAKWLPYAEARRRLTFENAKALLAKAEKFAQRQ